MKIKNIYLASLLLASASLSLSSCSQDSDPAEAAQNDQSISFAPYIAQTRADVANIETLKDDGFRVWISHNSGDTFDREVDNVGYLYNEDVQFSMPLDTWDYTNKRFWPADDAKLSFFALANGGQNLDTEHTKTAAGAPVYTFDCPARFENQIDLLAAQDLNKAKTANQIRFNFQHMLSKLQFAATSHVPSNYRITLKKVEVFYKSGAIRNKANIDLNNMSVTAVSDAYYTGGEAISAGVLYSSEVGMLLSDSESFSLVNQESDNYLMLVPQAYEGGDIYLTVSYDIDGSDDVHYGDGEGANLQDSYTDVKILLPTAKNQSGSNIGWQQGKQYTYVLDITADEVTFGGVQVADWGTQTGTNVPDVPVARNIYYQDGVFHINNAEGLKIFSDIISNRNQVKVGGYTADNGVPNTNHANGQLDSDIDLSTVCGASEELGSWQPIGTATYRYLGSFDGQNHYIDNLYINTSGNYQGLFGYANQNATISNVKLRGATITTNSYTGALLGQGDNMTVTNCHLEVDATHPAAFSVQYYCGALIGWHNYGTVSDCSVYIAGSLNFTGANYVGTLVGVTNPSTIIRCKVNVADGGQLSVTGSNEVGGFSGHGHGTFIDCSVATEDPVHNPIHIKATSGYAGGFVGETYNSKCVGCSSAVTTVEATSSTGYFAGSSYGTTMTYYGCWAYCAQPLSQKVFIGNNQGVINNSLYGSDPITDWSALNTDIATYNQSAEAGLQSVPFNTQGTYGPIRTTEPTSTETEE